VTCKDCYKNLTQIRGNLVINFLSKGHTADIILSFKISNNYYRQRATQHRITKSFKVTALDMVLVLDPELIS